MPAVEGALEALLPQRIILAAPRRPLLDELGFVLPLPADEVLSAADLLFHAAALIVAPPWTGKTFVAEKLHRALRSCPHLTPFGPLCNLTCFETLSREGEVKPTWWDGWATGEGTACWVVDAVDEDERNGDRRIDEILRLVEDLPEEARARLRILFFCRESEVPPAFLERSARLFGEWSPSHPGGLRRLRLAGLDRESARTLVGADAFERVCRIIETNRLKELAALPVVLEHLKGSPTAEPIDRLEVWRGVLGDLLWQRPGRPGRLWRSPSGIEAEDRFEVVQWLAAVLTFSSLRELHPSELEDLIPPDIPGGHFRLLREAAREAIRTAVFEPSSNGFRFAQDHVREWFAALALRDMDLLRARPLLTDGNGGPNPAHAGVMDLLARIARDSVLRAWIEQAYGGFVPITGAAPCTLEEAVRALDRLQELARSSPWGLAFWDEERLGRIAAPGLGEEIARRLAGPLLPAEQELLLEVALSVDAPEALAPAARMVQQGARAPRARILAANLLARLGGTEVLASLEPAVRSAGEGDGGVDSALPILAAALFRNSLWDFETAAGFALSRRPGNEWLQHLLAEELDLGRARHVAGRGAGIPEAPLVQQAVARLLEQEELSESDWDLLQPFALRGDALPGLMGEIERRPEARRRLFLEGLSRDPDPDGAWRWKMVLQEDDAEWLLDLARGRGGEPEWLRETLYLLSHRKGVGRSVRLRVRRAMEAWDAGLLLQLDGERERWRRSGPRRAGAPVRSAPEEPAGEEEIGALLAADPVAGWSRLAARMQEEGTLPVLLDLGSSLREADFESWPPHLIEQLASCLIEALPPGDEPERAGSMDPEEELRFLRDALLAFLLRRNQGEDAEVLESLALKHPGVRLWLDQTRAQQEAESVLAGLGERPSPPAGSIPVAQVVRLLQDSRYRLLRTADDLLDVVLEELEAVAGNARSHLPMLYRPRDRSGRRERLHEEALQAYLHCRLGDRLGSGILEPRPRILFLDREPLAARNTRNDLKIQTVSLAGKPLTLIIEVKWSDNVEVGTSLVEQLGRGYLLENGLTHGIYLVGWCGRGVWKGKEPKPASNPEAWQASLEEQARLFRQEQPGLRITPLVLDLSWEPSRREDELS